MGVGSGGQNSCRVKETVGRRRKRRSHDESATRNAFSQGQEELRKMLNDKNGMVSIVPLAYIRTYILGKILPNSFRAPCPPGAGAAPAVSLPPRTTP